MYYSLDNSAWSEDIPTAKNAGDYTVYYKVIGDETHADYTPAPNIVAATITKAPLTITASEKWIEYGDPLQYMGAIYTGFVNGEGPGYVQPAVKFSSDYTQGDNAGTYTITPYGAGAANYEISYVSGILLSIKCMRSSRPLRRLSTVSLLTVTHKCSSMPVRQQAVR